MSQVEDFVADLSTDAGVDQLKKTGVEIKERSSYRFKISFRVKSMIHPLPLTCKYT